jgi:hypothetical protein
LTSIEFHLLILLSIAECNPAAFLGLAQPERVQDWRFSASSERGVKEYLARLMTDESSVTTGSSVSDINHQRPTWTENNNLFLAWAVWCLQLLSLNFFSPTETTPSGRGADGLTSSDRASKAWADEWPSGGPAKHARLWMDGGRAWCPAVPSDEEFLQIDLGVPSQVYGP